MLASWFIFLGRVVLLKGVIFIALPLPGWFVNFKSLIYVEPKQDKKLKNCIQWTIYDMPEKWSEQIDELMKRRR